jgi:hypothetical protein
MAQIGTISLFEYLKKPAGIELGTAVYQAARRARSPIGIRQVKTKKYTGKVILYTQEFLDEYFKKNSSVLTSTKNKYMNETNNSLFTATAGTATLANSGYSGTINGSSGITSTLLSYSEPVSTNLNSRSTMTIAGTGIDSGVVLQGNSTINYSPLLSNSNNMKPTQVKVAVFTITRDEDTNEINSSKFLKEFWVEQKNGVSIDLVVAKQLDKDFDPETTIIKVLSTVSF